MRSINENQSEGKIVTIVRNDVYLSIIGIDIQLPAGDVFFQWTIIMSSLPLAVKLIRRNLKCNRLKCIITLIVIQLTIVVRIKSISLN